MNLDDELRKLISDADMEQAIEGTLSLAILLGVFWKRLIEEGVPNDVAPLLLVEWLKSVMQLRSLS